MCLLHISQLLLDVEAAMIQKLSWLASRGRAASYVWILHVQIIASLEAPIHAKPFQGSFGGTLDDLLVRHICPSGSNYSVFFSTSFDLIMFKNVESEASSEK